jgi:hypothetical protein
MSEHPAFRTFLALWDRAVGTSGYSKPEWRLIRSAFGARNAGGMEAWCTFFRLRDEARARPDYNEADWRAVGDALGFHDD